MAAKKLDQGEPSGRTLCRASFSESALGLSGNAAIQECRGNGNSGTMVLRLGRGTPWKEARHGQG